MRYLIPFVLLAVAAAVLAGEDERKVDPVRIPAIVDLANANCPVSGKPVADKTYVDASGVRVHFCCGKCAAKFKEKPAPILEKMGVKTVKTEGGAMVTDLANNHCPITGEAAQADVFTDREGVRVHYCCPGCEKKLAAEPVKAFKAIGYNYIPAVIDVRNGACPVSGEELEADAEPVTSDHDGIRVHFCCEKCVAKFQKEPAAVFQKLGVDPKKLKAETK